MQNFSDATENYFSREDIIVHEQLIMKNLQWEINLPNFSTWINNTTMDWDLFIDNIHIFSEDIAFDVNDLKSFKFRDRNPRSFNLFCTLTQYIDIICLDIGYLSYLEKYLIISIIFLLILKCFGIVDFSQIAFLQMENIEQLNYEFVLFFNRFLNKFYNMEFVNIFDHIQFVSCYMDSNLNLNNLAELEEVIFFYFYHFFYLRQSLMKNFCKFKLIIARILIMIPEQVRKK